MNTLVKPTEVKPPLGDVIGVVLAGGRSQRMGEDKRFLCFAGKTLLEHAKLSLGKLQLRSVLVSSADIKNTVEDQQPGQGPLGGMMSVFSQYAKPDIRGFLFVPVDMPLLTGEVLFEIAKQGLDSRVPVCFKQQYLPLYLPNISGVAEQITIALEQHNGAVRRLISGLNGKQLDVTEHQTKQNIFINLNRPQDWNELVSESQHRRSNGT